MSGKHVVQLTRSQHLALIDLICHSLQCRCDSRIEQYIDASTNTVTTPGELLRLVSDSPFFADGGLIIEKTKARSS